MWQYSFYIVTSWLSLSWFAQFLEKHVTGIKSLWMLMCSSFEPQRILILLPSSTNSCTVFSYLTAWNQIARHDWPECKYCCLVLNSLLFVEIQQTWQQLIYSTNKNKCSGTWKSLSKQLHQKKCKNNYLTNKLINFTIPSNIYND